MLTDIKHAMHPQTVCSKTASMQTRDTIGKCRPLNTGKIHVVYTDTYIDVWYIQGLKTTSSESVSWPRLYGAELTHNSFWVQGSNPECNKIFCNIFHIFTSIVLTNNFFNCFTAYRHFLFYILWLLRLFSVRIFPIIKDMSGITTTDVMNFSIKIKNILFLTRFTIGEILWRLAAVHKSTQKFSGQATLANHYNMYNHFDQKLILKKPQTEGGEKVTQFWSHLIFSQNTNTIQFTCMHVSTNGNTTASC